jgi:hypothetical protein
MSVPNRSRKFVAETTLADERDRLIGRLTDGDAVITEGKRNGKDTSAWETGWIRLLREYEQVCRRIEAES